MSEDSLVNLNGALHEHLNGLWMNAMVAITRLDLPESVACWQRFDLALKGHADLEDAVALPVFAALEAFPRGATPDIMDNEHRKLARMCSDGRQALEILSTASMDDGRGLDGMLDDALRRQMIDALPRLQRVQHLLEHHTLREQQLVYPAIVAQADPATVDAVGQALKAQLDAWTAEAERL